MCNLRYVLCATRFCILFFSFGSLTLVQSSSILRSLGLGNDDEVEGILELFRRFRMRLMGRYGTPVWVVDKEVGGGGEAAGGDVELGEAGKEMGGNATAFPDSVAEPAG